MLVFLAICAAQVPDLGTRKDGGDWPGLLGPNRDGKSPERGIITRWPLRVVWEREIGVGYPPSSVSRGRLFHFDQVRDKARLRCMKSESGDELWKFEYVTDYEDQYGAGDGPRCPPLVDGERVVVFDAAGILHCLRVVDGSIVWKKNTSKEFGVVQNFFGVGSTPIVEGDLLLCQVGGSPPNSPGIGSGRVRGLDSGIVAYDKLTGKVVYKITNELASYSSLMTATIHGRRWGFGFCRGGLVGFEPAAGKVDFHYPWRAELNESVNVVTPVVAGDLVFICESYGVGGSVVKVRPGGYDVAWTGHALDCYFNTPIHLDGYLYGSAGTGSSDAELKCVEMATGKIQWSEAGLRRSSLLYVDGHFVCLSEDGTLRLLKVNPKRYEQVSRADLKLRQPAWAAPILSHGLLYVRGKDLMLCLELIPAK